MALEVYRKFQNNNHKIMEYLNLINQKLSRLEKDVKTIKDTLRSDITKTY